MTKEFRTVYKIPQYLVQDFGDDGISHYQTDGEKYPETDDLRVTVELSGGLNILISGNMRIIMTDDYLEIQSLVETKE